MRQCKSCDEPWSSLIDRLLLQGHSYLCVLWHLKRLDYAISLDTLVTHTESHKPFSLCDDREHIFVSHWQYVPPSVPRVAPDAPPELLLIRGLPGSGKTKHALRYASTHVHLEADLFFSRFQGHLVWHAPSVPQAHRWAELWTAAALHAHQNVVVANTFLTNAFLEPYYALAAEAGAYVRILTCPPPLTPPRTIASATMARYAQCWEPLRTEMPLAGHIAVADVREDAPACLSPLSMPVFCQPFLCRHKLGIRWLQTVSTSLVIADQLRQPSTPTKSAAEQHALMVDGFEQAPSIYKTPAEAFIEGLADMQTLTTDIRSMLADIRTEQQVSIALLRKHLDSATPFSAAREEE